MLVAQRVHPEVAYELVFLQAEPAQEGSWRLPGEAWNGRLDGCHKLFLVADEPPSAVGAALSAALKQLARSGCMIGGLSAGVYPGDAGHARRLPRCGALALAG